MHSVPASGEFAFGGQGLHELLAVAATLVEKVPAAQFVQEELVVMFA